MTTETLLVELGTEELPPKSLKALGLAFRDGIVAGLAERELDHGAVHWFATPRRLAVMVENTTLRSPDKTIEVLGPPADRAKDENGEWTPAANGFARKQGVAPEQLQEIETDKGARLGISKTEAGGVRSTCTLAAGNDRERIRFWAGTGPPGRPGHPRPPLSQPGPNYP
jgi:glycyl-tRNA synthetase beta chain